MREVCVGNAQTPSVSTFNTNVLENGRPFYLTPYESVMQLKEKLSYVGKLVDGPSNRLEANTKRASEHNLGHTVFSLTENDNKLLATTSYLEIQIALRRQIIIIISTEIDKLCMYTYSRRYFFFFFFTQYTLTTYECIT